MARILLAAIDHNCHAFRKPALSEDGKLKYNKLYSKRSKNWRVQVVKEDKTYPFWPVLASRICQNRVQDEESITRRVVIPADHPKNIAPSIALKPIPKTLDLVEKSLSRFAKVEPPSEEANITGIDSFTAEVMECD